MQIIRPEGHSYTKADDVSFQNLRRGLIRDQNRQLTPMKYKRRLIIEPMCLRDYLNEDYRLALRQIISVLDKVITKPRNLGRCHLRTYVDRTLLAAALWTRLEGRFCAAIRNLENGEDAFLEFRRTWDWKFHPYAEKTCDWNNPSQDQNADIINKLARNDVSREAAQGRWRNALWKTTGGQPDYELTADSIWSHLFAQEIKING